MYILAFDFQTLMRPFGSLHVFHKNQATNPKIRTLTKEDTACEAEPSVEPLNSMWWSSNRLTSSGSWTRPVLNARGPPGSALGLKVPLMVVSVMVRSVTISCMTHCLNWLYEGERVEK